MLNAEWRAKLIAAAALVAVASVARADIIDRVMAVVAGQPITLSDVNAASELKLVTPDPSQGDPVAATLDRLIRRTLIIGEVDRYQPPEPAPEEIDRRYAAVVERVGGEAALQRVFTLTGMTADQLRRWVRDDLRMDTYFNQRFGTGASRAEMIDDWVQGLRRRADVTVLYVAPSAGTTVTRR
jgi:parvulin-like peptidyl-prolyl isomerase